MTTTQILNPTTGPTLGGPNGLAAHSHVGGRTVRTSGVASHLHPVASTDVADHPVPTSKSELWKFAPLRRLRGLHADAEFTVGALTATWDAVDGADVRVVSGAAGRALKGASDYLPTDRVTARLMEHNPDTLLIDVPADSTVAEPVVVTIDGADASIAEAAHILLRLGNHAAATVVLKEQGSATVAHLVEIMVGDGANLNLATIADWAADTVQLAHHHISVGRDAKVKHSLLTFGGDVVRTSVDVDYRGPGGDLEMLGLYFADAGQYLEHRIFIDHTAANCRSEVLYKGALQGERARTAWVGDVLIRATAEGTDSYEMNRNLLLTDGARADSVPNLEIETGEIIKAAHASATGRYDDDHLFYLQSRGITPEMAKRLVVRGFFHEVLHKVGISSVIEHISQTVERELAISGM
ncbi:MAG: Fe-S cluster assembly protein SufD [Actinobacteria bacterium 69-20]|nr:Fe-S cluster assembly protein SufD [Actinomycetota bacterium]OJV30316.1 MAG: Fe-S cluster assembly protein SufD [Actinobacteria bacterium 69-20]